MTSTRTTNLEHDMGRTQYAPITKALDVVTLILSRATSLGARSDDPGLTVDVFYLDPYQRFRANVTAVGVIGDNVLLTLEPAKPTTQSQKVALVEQALADWDAAPAHLDSIARRRLAEHLVRAGVMQVND